MRWTDGGDKGRKDREETSTSRFLTSSLTLALVSEDCFPLDASLISVDKKFRHFFTFSRVSWKHKYTHSICFLYKYVLRISTNLVLLSYSRDRGRSARGPTGPKGPYPLCYCCCCRTRLHCGWSSYRLSWGGGSSSQHDGVLEMRSGREQVTVNSAFNRT